MDNAAIEEMFESLGRISIRRLFGGKGIYFEGVIIAIEYEGGILLKGDDQSAAALEAAGGKRWGYQARSGKLTYMPYWSVPETAFDDPDDMAQWVRLAYEAGCGIRRPRPPRPQASSAMAARLKTESGSGRSSSANQPKSDSLSGSVSCGSPENAVAT